MHWNLWVWLSLLLLGDGTTTQDRALWVYAGAGFRAPIEEAARVFSDRNQVDIDTTFAGSGCLLAQAELAGKGDVFLPGELHYLEAAQKRGLADQPVSIAYLQPTIAVPRGNPRGIQSLSDLAQDGLRLGLGDPESVAVGLATQRWIDATLDADAAAALRKNVITRALNVNELGTQLTLGGIDAVVVWDASLPLFPQLEAVPDATATAHRTVITGGVLSLSRAPELARAFLEFLSSSKGAAIFRRFGYQPFRSAP